MHGHPDGFKNSFAPISIYVSFCVMNKLLPYQW